MWLQLINLLLTKNQILPEKTFFFRFFCLYLPPLIFYIPLYPLIS